MRWEDVTMGCGLAVKEGGQSEHVSPSIGCRVLVLKPWYNQINLLNETLTVCLNDARTANRICQLICSVSVDLANEATKLTDAYRSCP